MNVLSLFNPPNLYIEIDQSSLKVLDGEEGLELPLERQDNGLLTAAGKERLVLSLRDFLQKQGWRPRQRAFCALGARGVSLRRMKLPATNREEWQRVLRLQIENEFPLSPDELAWGCRPANGEGFNGSGVSQEWVVVAVKKEVVEDYAQVLVACGLTPVFTLGALARSGLCPEQTGSWAVLDVSSHCSELICFDQGAPASIRILPWGAEAITRSIEKQLGVGHDEAERLQIQASQEPGGPVSLHVSSALQSGLEELSRSIQGSWSGKTLYVAGSGAKLIVPGLRQIWGGGLVCEPIDWMPGKGRTAAILGMRQFCERNGGAPPLIIEARKAKTSENLGRPATLMWAVMAVALVMGMIILRYTEVYLNKPRLARKIAEAKAGWAKLPNLDRQLNFLQYLKTNQPPYLEAVVTIANAAAPGMRLESLAMNRRGDLSFHGYVRDMQQALDFRAKLDKTGFFTSVVFEEQSPTADRQKMNMRIVASWKPVAAREALARELARIGSAPTNAPGKEAKPAAPEKAVGSAESSPPLRTGVVPTEGPPPTMSSPPGSTGTEKHNAESAPRVGPTLRRVEAAGAAEGKD